jgi:ubiquinone/menaquinone biosynthesis C-methylase UbiE
MKDVITTAETILNTCGTGRFLVVGSGASALTRELVQRGETVSCLDESSAAVDQLNRYVPGLAVLGLVAELPFPDSGYDTIIVSGALESATIESIPRTFTEFWRVTRKYVFLRIAIGPGINPPPKLMLKPKPWWENMAFEAGFRKHPATLRAIPFDAVEHEDNTFTILLEKIPAQVSTRYPLAGLRAERDLHMDMLRESGRRSDAHLHRYELASSLVRPGDRVLDAACGLGYGSHLLASLTPAGEVLGVDLSESAVAYAQDNFGTADGRLRFQQGNVENLSFLPDMSIDLIASFETLEHIPSPGTFLKEALRVLRPGGRILASVPNRWDDGTGHDPSPHHLHVYDWQRLHAEFSRYFLVEKGYGETAGGGMRLGNHPRDAFGFDPDAGPSRDSEWLLIQAMADPMAGEGLPYHEQMYPEEERPDNLIEFNRDYLNPYLPHAMVSMPWRLDNQQGLRRLAQQVVERYPGDSADFGAGLCVLAYQFLHDNQMDAAAIQNLLSRISAYLSVAKNNPHVLRWQISTAYAAGLLCQKIGDAPNAVIWFERCASYDFNSFSPTLCTKSLASAWHLGKLQAGMGHKEAAIAALNNGLDRFFGVLSSGRARFIGHAERPFDFPFFELTEAITCATNCVNLIRQLTSPNGQIHSALPVENLQATIRGLKNSIVHTDVHTAASSLALRIAKKYQQRDRIVIFGCGKLGRDLLSVLNSVDIPVESIADNEPSNWGVEINGVIVSSPEKTIIPGVSVAIASTIHAASMLADVERLSISSLGEIFIP